MKQLTLIIVSLFLSPVALAKSPKNVFSLDASIGVLNGTSTELVYEDSGEKLSQLDWDIKNVPIIKLGGQWDVDSITIRGNVWTSLTDEGDANMVDRDWLTPNQSAYSDISISPNTQLTQAVEYDLNLTYWIVEHQNYKIGVLGGYQYTNFKWDAIGGVYSYDNGADIGVLPNMKGIDYEQKFNAPYIGISGNYNNNNSEINMLIKWSAWVDSRDTDNHYARDLTFHEKSNAKSEFVSLSLNYGYYIKPNIKIFGEYAYSKYFKANADTTIVDNISGDSDTVPNSAGLDHDNYTLTAGVKYIF